MCAWFENIFPHTEFVFIFHSLRVKHNTIKTLLKLQYLPNRFVLKCHKTIFFCGCIQRAPIKTAIHIFFNVGLCMLTLGIYDFFCRGYEEHDTENIIKLC